MESNLFTKAGIAMIAFYLILFINYLLFFPVIIYHLCIFWRFRQSDVIKKRRPKLVLLIAIFLMIYILLFRSWTAYADILYPSIDRLHQRPPYQNYTFCIFLSYFLYLIALLILLRSWFVYYDYQRNAQLLSLEWKKLLRYNSSIIHRDNPWTLTCAPILGNMQFLIACAVFLFFVTQLVIIAVSWSYDPIAFHLTQMIMNIFIGIAAVILFYHSLKLKDCIGIRAEIGVIVALFVLFAVVYVVIIVFFDELSYERTLLVYALYSVISFVGILRMTRIRWLLSNVVFGKRTVRKIRKISHTIQNSINASIKRGSIEEDLDGVVMNEYPDTPTSNNTTPVPSAPASAAKDALNLKNDASTCSVATNRNIYKYSPAHTQDEGEMPKLFEVLSDKIGFELFAAHLVHELAVEHILFLIELFQLKQTLIEYGYVHKCKWNIDIMNKEFIVALCYIDYTINNENVIQKCIDFECYLYDQYIAANSQLTINIKSRTRAKIAHWINQNHDILHGNGNSKEKERILTKDKLNFIGELFVLLHDNAGHEVYSLLALDSYYRFGKTVEFKAWHQHTNGVESTSDDA